MQFGAHFCLNYITVLINISTRCGSIRLRIRPEWLAPPPRGLNLNRQSPFSGIAGPAPTTRSREITTCVENPHFDFKCDLLRLWRKAPRESIAVLSIGRGEGWQAWRCECQCSRLSTECSSNARSNRVQALSPRMRRSTRELIHNVTVYPTGVHQCSPILWPGSQPDPDSAI